MYKLPKSFCPKFKTKLTRLGQTNDGGYNIPEKLLEEATILFSFGLDEDWSFEEEFKKKTGSKILCFDNSVNNKFWFKRLIKSIIYFNFKKNYFNQIKKLFTFLKYTSFFRQHNTFHIKKHLVSNNIILPESVEHNFINLKEIFKTWGGGNFFLKMDIEGNEYRVLDDIIQNQNNMLGLVIEFHDCDLMQNKINEFVENLSLDLVHIHVNNFCSIAKNDFPTVLELTFSLKKYNLKRNIEDIKFPDKEIDQPNNRELEDKEISFY